MKNQELVVLKGLPASGKSTYAKDLVKKNPNWKRVNKDDLRSMIDGSKFTKGNEKAIIKARDTLVNMWLAEGFNVVVDDTSLAKKHEINLFHIAQEHGVMFSIKEFSASVEECIKRDTAREKSVGADVIMNMFNQYLDVRLVHMESKDKVDAIIVDIDGTLATRMGRSPFDWERVKEDKVQEHVKLLVNTFYPLYTVILMSGRDSVCRGLTEEWLAENGIKYDFLIMREAGNNEKDTTLKKRLYRDEVEHTFNVKFVVDDRPSVIRMWKEEGLNVLNADSRMYLSEF